MVSVTLILVIVMPHSEERTRCTVPRSRGSCVLCANTLPPELTPNTSLSIVLSLPSAKRITGRLESLEMMTDKNYVDCVCVVRSRRRCMSGYTD